MNPVSANLPLSEQPSCTQSAEGSLTVRQTTPLLPVPPTSKTGEKKDAARLRLECVKFYYVHHFANGPFDPASFIDRIMTDYADYEQDVVGDWVANMSPLYKLYKACIKYVIEHGSLEISEEARRYQAVTRFDGSSRLTDRWVFRDIQMSKIFGNIIATERLLQ